MKTPRPFHHHAAALILALAAAFSTAPASVPGGPPVFSHPLDITNPFHPFQPGGVKVFTGIEENKKHVTIYDFMTETRSFILGGKNVDCRILREMSFDNGEVVEISFNHFAQADDGSVYYFGEVVNIYENGAIVNHEGSWLVGGPGASDPPETATATTPGLIMPANPELGDTFKPEDLFPIVDETSKVVRTNVRIQVPAGHFRHGIEIKETSQLPGGTEHKIYIPGVGEVQAWAKGELQRLIVTTFAPAP